MRGERIKVVRREGPSEYEVYAVKLKNMGKDSFGNDKVIWVVKSQKEIIEKMRNNPETRYNFIEVGDITFSPMDVAWIEKRVESGNYLPKYVKIRYIDDNNRNGLKEVPYLTN